MRIHLLAFSLVIACTILPLTSIAQSDVRPSLAGKSLWRVGLLNFVKPGVSYELGVSRRISLFSVANLRTDYTSYSEQNKPTIWYRSIIAQASLSTRYYYNLERRLNAGKNIHYNSGNYLSLGAYYTSPAVAHWGEQSLSSSTHPQGLDNTVNIRMLWGIQRQLPPKRFYYDFSAGLQINTNKPNDSFHDALTAQLIIGYCLTK